ncbi:hypothetical protein EHM92_06100, partial [bacterium]
MFRTGFSYLRSGGHPDCRRRSGAECEFRSNRPRGFTEGCLDGRKCREGSNRDRHRGFRPPAILSGQHEERGKSGLLCAASEKRCDPHPPGVRGQRVLHPGRSPRHVPPDVSGNHHVLQKRKQPMNEHLHGILEGFNRLRIGVLGDFCIDAYWLLDQTHLERSLETGKPTNAICEQSYGLGGAGNVVSNLVALGVAEVSAFGVIGDDIFGREMLDLMRRLGVQSAGMLVQEAEWATAVYAKPYVDLEEGERFDFGRFNSITDQTADRLLACVEQRMKLLNALIINQQLKQGIHSDYLVAGLQALVDRYPDRIFLLDARDISDRYRGMIFKLNAAEAARLCGQERVINQAITVEELTGYATQISARTGKEVIITRSDRGIMAYDRQTVYQVPGILVIGPTDPVGAGDTTASAITASLASGTTLAEAIEIGNYAAGVTVRKLRQTGTATQSEVREL